MKRILTLLFILVQAVLVRAQVVSTQPALPVENKPVTIVFRADQGTGGLAGYTGDVYAHTGVITSKSTSGADWKYVVTEWGENIAKTKLTQTGANLYQLVIEPDIRSYYGVPEDEEILKLAFVFRSATQVGGSWKEGKAAGGSDIFVDVYKESLKAYISSPLDKALFLPGQGITIQGNGLNAERLRLYLDDVLIKETNDATVTHSFSAPASGSHQLRLEAYMGEDADTHVINFYIRQETEIATRPAGLKPGVNVVDDNTVTLLLQAPGKGYIFVIGDFNEWAPMPDYQMKRDGDYFWLTIDGLEPDVEYAYQYYIDGALKLADPFTTKVLDEQNDKYIPETVYPDLKAFPSEYTSGLASVLTTTPHIYEWKVQNFQVPEKEKLVIYEVLIRDFTDNGDIKTITDTLDYFVRLGVNAIELMPINEFEGNDSWGYNPSFYFAPDKAYGTMNDYKEFIDACHERGIAVIIDMVLNHSYGESPLVQMYLDGSKPAANNPWYNVSHNMQNPDAQWGYDFNHESPYTQELVDLILEYWITEFKVDGFRFDFTKGFTNTPYGPSSWASEYDASRIAILKRIADKVWSVKEDALVIFEHLAENTEEKVLADYGILLWGNMNYNFSEAVMGYHDEGKSDFNWSSYKNRNWNEPNLVAYMESHDEERITFRSRTYGIQVGSYNVRNLKTSLERHQAATVFLLSIPGPKMIWQFGELGYDISIDQGGRLSKKPTRWNYLEVNDRKALWDIYAEMIDLKKKEPIFATNDFTLDVAGQVKRILLNSENNSVRLVGNFGTSIQTVSPGFNSTGKWFNHFAGDSIIVSSLNQEVQVKPGEFIMFTKQKFASFDPASSVGRGPSYADKRTSIFPNPFVGDINLRTEEPLKSVEIYDVNGRLVESFADPDAVLNLSRLHPGVYMLYISTKRGSSEVHKLVKTR